MYIQSHFIKYIIVLTLLIIGCKSNEAKIITTYNITEMYKVWDERSSPQLINCHTGKIESFLVWKKLLHQ
jgi:hypothetical protein